MDDIVVGLEFKFLKATRNLSPTTGNLPQF